MLNYTQWHWNYLGMMPVSGSSTHVSCLKVPRLQSGIRDLKQTLLPVV